MKKELVLIFFSILIINQVNAAYIEGTIFKDFDGNGVLEKETISNVNLSLFNIEKFEEIIITTNENGYYKFDLQRGSYIITQKLNNDEIFTYPEFGFYHIIINDNEIFNEKNFGKFKLGKISGYVFNSNNEKLANIRVSLSNNFSYLTNLGGYYEFTNLEAGNYTISINENKIDVVINSGIIVENNNFILTNYIQEENIIEEESWFQKLIKRLI